MRIVPERAVRSSKGGREHSIIIRDPPLALARACDARPRLPIGMRSMTAGSLGVRERPDAAAAVTLPE
jgi:hypothetical protein